MIRRASLICAGGDAKEGRWTVVGGGKAGIESQVMRDFF